MLYHLFISLLAPMPVVFLTVLAVSVHLWRRRPDARGVLLMVLAPVAALLATCTPVAAYFLAGSLEWQYPPGAMASTEAEVIVVLGGQVSWPLGDRRSAALCEDSMARCVRAAELYHAGPPRLVVASGGNVNRRAPGVALSDVMRDFLIRLGVPEQQVLAERESRNTWQNAECTARLLRRRGLSNAVIVTDAAHLPRAVGCFRNQGSVVAADGCRRRAAGIQWSVFAFVPNPHAAESVAFSMREWLGLSWYWMQGRLVDRTNSLALGASAAANGDWLDATNCLPSCGSDDAGNVPVPIRWTTRCAPESGRAPSRNLSQPYS